MKSFFFFFLRKDLCFPKAHIHCSFMLFPPDLGVRHSCLHALCAGNTEAPQGGCGACRNSQSGVELGVVFSTLPGPGLVSKGEGRAGRMVCLSAGILLASWQASVHVGHRLTGRKAWAGGTVHAELWEEVNLATTVGKDHLGHRSTRRMEVPDC